MGMAMPPNWDGLGGRQISLATCKAAMEFFREASEWGVPRPKFASPSALGAIAFQWNTPARRLKVRVFSAGRQGCHFEWIDLPDAVERGQGDIDTVAKRLSRFFCQGFPPVR